MPIRFSATITKAERVDESLLLLTVRADTKFPRVDAGQFFHLAIDSFEAGSHWPESRAFSIAASSQSGEYRFIISRAGCFVERLWQTAESGMPLWLKGPYGELDIELDDVPPSSDVVFVAAGSGVSPFLSLITKRIGSLSETRSAISLLYSARTPSLLSEREVFRDLARCHQEVFSAEFFVTRESVLPSEDWAFVRRMNGEDLMSRVKDLNSTHVFLSGPSELVVGLRAHCIAEGMAPENIHFDDWG